MQRFTLLTSVAVSVVLAVPQQQFNFPDDGRNENQQNQQNQQNEPQYSATPIPIISQTKEQNPDGSYYYSYETGNGIAAEERGVIKNLGQPDNEINSVQGFYSYRGTDGLQYSVSYTADERGFVAQGPHIPTSPPMPAAIAKALENLPQDNTEYDDNGFPLPPREGGFQQQQQQQPQQQNSQPTGFSNSPTGFSNSQSRPSGPSASSGPSSGPSSFGNENLQRGFGGRA